MENGSFSIYMKSNSTKIVKGSIGGIVYYVDGDGLYHNTKGPAVIWNDGEKEYWLHGKKLSYKIWHARTTILGKWKLFCEVNSCIWE